ncbi:MAG: glycosyltransferase [Culturomica sp.]|jgi:glycosyltransferase involved in cell wall biosynthesis|nr:glycosyltransferase [Culturomica sp.]
MHKPEVSIIVPVYNTADLLHKSIRSLLQQTLPEIEIILVDDASTDDSLAVMRAYEQQHPDRIKVLHSGVNQRQGGARNLGIEAARGEYIGFVDSDDWAEPEMYEQLYREARKNNADMCYCFRKQVSETGKTTKDSATYFLPAGEITPAKRKEMIVNHVTFIQRYIYKRSLFVEHDIRFPAHLRYEDMLIDPLMLLYAGRIACVRSPLFNYFIRSGSTMTEKNGSKYKDKMAVSRLIVEEYKKRGCYEAYKDEVHNLYFRKGYVHAALNYLINAERPDKQVIRQIRTQLLEIDKSYKTNSYYKKRLSFRFIDRILSGDSSFLLRSLKWMLALSKYNV